MRYRRLGQRHLIRLDRGEEILDAVKGFVRRRDLPGGIVSGLGASDDMTVAFYDTAAKEYRSYRRTGLIEILSLAGNVSWRGGEPVVHLHVSASEEASGAFGGHLVKGTVSATVEIVIDPFEERLERAMDDEIGLPLLDLPEVDR